MRIYYRVWTPESISIEYKSDGEKIYDDFKGMMFFTSWAENEFKKVELIEINDHNYEELRKTGEVC